MRPLAYALVGAVEVLRCTSTVPSTSSPTAPPAASRAIEALSVDLYRELAKQDKNVVASPYSIAGALAMTRLGAAGRTAAEMDTVLKASVTGDLDGAMNALATYLSPSGQDEAIYVVGGGRVERWPRSEPMALCV